MSTAIDFGLFDWLDVGPGPLSELYEARLQLIEMADRAGFFGYHLSEHHGTTLGMAPSPSLFFAALAQRTSKIRFGPMAYLLPMYHPLRLIEEICMLDHMSHGRLEVGVSRGVSPYEMQCFGVHPDESREIFAETLDILRAATSTDVLEHNGKHYQFHDVPMEIKPLQAPYPPLWYPSFSQSGVEYAASNGYHFMSVGPPGLIAKLMATYREIHAAHANDADRINGHIDSPKLGAMRQIFVAETDEQAMAIARPAYETWYQSITKLWRRHNDNSYDDFFRWDPSIAGETVLVGSVEKVRDQIQQLVSDSGINYFVGSFTWGSLAPVESQRSLELFISEIVPAITAS